MTFWMVLLAALCVAIVFALSLPVPKDGIYLDDDDWAS